MRGETIQERKRKRKIKEEKKIAVMVHGTVMLMGSKRMRMKTRKQKRRKDAKKNIRKRKKEEYGGQKRRIELIFKAKQDKEDVDKGMEEQK